MIKDTKVTTMTHEDGLREWAKGLHPLVAATELLIRASGGRFARPGNPWIIMDEDFSWIDFTLIPDNIGALSSGERRLLMLTASLADVGVEVNLGDMLPGLDREVLELVLAASAHAAGSHEHSGILTNADGSQSFERLATLYPWPAE